jgi:hypothetical protein
MSSCSFIEILPPHECILTVLSQPCSIWSSGGDWKANQNLRAWVQAEQMPDCFAFIFPYAPPKDSTRAEPLHFFSSQNVIE